MNEKYKDIVTGELCGLEDGLFLIDLDQQLYDFVRHDFPQIKGDEFISFDSLMPYRMKKIDAIIVNDYKDNKRMRDRFTKVLIDENYQEMDVQQHLDETGTFGQRVADSVAKFGGSWPFIIGFLVFLTFWVVMNTFHLFGKNFDPYPFILLNLALSMLAALQAPLIMMSQNRASEYDRLESQNDYRVNKKTEVEMRLLHSKIDHLIQQDQPNLLEIQKLQTEMLSSLDRQLKEFRNEIKVQR